MNLQVALNAFSGLSKTFNDMELGKGMLGENIWRLKE